MQYSTERKGRKERKEREEAGGKCKKRRGKGKYGMKKGERHMGRRDGGEGTRADAERQ